MKIRGAPRTGELPIALLASASAWPTSNRSAPSTTPRPSAGPLADVVAPPYDVIDPSQRAALLERSPFNVVAVDLPAPSEAGGDPYEAARQLFESWQSDGVLARDEEPALWAHTQDYAGPDGVARTRQGFFCRVRIEGYGPGRVRPHERTHPGPKEDRLRLTRATRANISPIFSLYSDPAGAAWGALGPFTAQTPWGDVTDGDGTRHRLWHVSDPAAIAAVQEALSDAELLIADGHHRYETMDAYAEEIGGEGEHRYILMCLVALEDPGLDDLPHPPADPRARRRPLGRPRCCPGGELRDHRDSRVRARARALGGDGTRWRWATSTDAAGAASGCV